MKSHKDVRFLVMDNGLVGIPIAERLARDMAKGWVFFDYEKGQNKFEEAIVGEGFESVERCYDIWDVMDEVDLVVFPDVGRAGLQKHIEGLGKKVWGSRAASLQELDRELFLCTLKEVGLPVLQYEVIIGVTKLRDFLKDKKDYYVKMSYYRGSFETTHFRTWKEDRHWLDSLGVRFGPFQDMMRFICCPSIDTPLEIGADTYNIDGKWPSKMLHGIEHKDKSYLGAVTEWSQMPKVVRQVLTAYGSVLGKSKFRNQFSCEIRVKGADYYFTDPTCRFGLPSTPSQLELWKNWSEVVWHGANGELVEPVANAKYSAESMVYFPGEHNEWRVVELPKGLRQWFKIADGCMIGDLLAFPPSDAPGGDEVGWLCAIGDSPEQVVKQINKHADMLPDGLDANTESLAYVIKEIKVMESKGIHFGSSAVPLPALAVA